MSDRPVPAPAGDAPAPSVLRPDSEEALARCIAEAEGPLRIRGGGTRDLGGSAAPAILDTGGLAGLELYDPGALTLVARAGTTLAEVEATLAAEGQMLAFEPCDLAAITGAAGRSTLGGVVATNASGPRRVRAGAARDFLLGVRFVDGRGRIVSNGGRVMKNVTGYDLVKLMAGSRGTLGVLTEVALKVLPRPEAQRTLVLHDLSDDDAIGCLAAGMASPFEVTGALHLSPGPDRTAALTALRIEGFAQSVDYRAGRLAAHLAPFGPAEILPESEIWEEMRRFAPFVGVPQAAFWLLSLKPSDAPGVARRHLVPAGARYAYDWAGGRLIVQATGGLADLHRALQADCARLGGHATLVHGPGSLIGAVPELQPEPAPVAALSEGLRRAFDPSGILNPGIMR